MTGPATRLIMWLALALTLVNAKCFGGCSISSCSERSSPWTAPAQCPHQSAPSDGHAPAPHGNGTNCTHQALVAATVFPGVAQIVVPAAGPELAAYIRVDVAARDRFFEWRNAGITPPLLAGIVSTTALRI